MSTEAPPPYTSTVQEYEPIHSGPPPQYELTLSVRQVSAQTSGHTGLFY